MADGNNCWVNINGLKGDILSFTLLENIIKITLFYLNWKSCSKIFIFCSIADETIYEFCEDDLVTEAKLFVLFQLVNVKMQYLKNLRKILRN